MTGVDADSGALRLHSGAPWWLVADGLPLWQAGPADGKVDVAIIGAGVTGALLGDLLAREGRQVLLIDRRTPATGSTAASTGLLQYEIDVELQDLVELVGERDAVRAYELCSAAIHEVDRLASGLDVNCGFARYPSAYVASRKRHRQRLDREFAVRFRCGLEVERLDADELESRSGLRGHGALWSPNAAVVDPLALATGLLRRAQRQGARLLPHTVVQATARDGDGWILDTSRGRVAARDLVYATGYEVPESIRRDIVNLNSTFALVTEPLDDLGPWGGRCIAWETVRPYAYLRPAGDRLVAGGGDVEFQDAGFRDAILSRRVKKLERRIREKWLRGLPWTTAFSWGGTFGETKDGLPYVGTAPELHGAHVALGYGGNGITFGVVAATIIADLLVGRRNPDARIFRLDR